MRQQEKYDWMVYVSCMTFNHAPYIVDAMNGFTMQETNFPFVCAIVDDASTDGEQEVIKNYLNEHFDLEDKNVARHKETDDYVLTFARHKTNLNCHFAVLYLKYNHYKKKPKAPYLAQWRDKAKYIANCEGDDYWTAQDKLQKQVDFMDNHPDISYTCTRYNIVNEKTGDFSLASNFYFDKFENREKDVFVFQRNAPFLEGWITKTLTCMYRNKDYDTVFLRKFKYCRDVHLVYLLLSKGKGACFSFIGGVYRLNPSSTYGGKTRLEQVAQNYYVYEELYQKTKDNVIREKVMEFYLILFRNRVYGFRFPRTIIQFYAIFIKLPKSRLFNFRKLI